MDELSTRQQEILQLIRTKVAERGYPPSVREIGEVLGLRSPSTVHSHLSSLVRSGYLRRDPSKPRAIEVVESGVDHIDRSPNRDVPLLGRIAAGSPILAEEQIEEIFTLPTEFTGTGPVFMLAVRGLRGDPQPARRRERRDRGRLGRWRGCDRHTVRATGKHGPAHLRESSLRADGFRRRCPTHRQSGRCVARGSLIE